MWRRQKHVCKGRREWGARAAGGRLEHECEGGRGLGCKQQLKVGRGDARTTGGHEQGPGLGLPGVRKTGRRLRQWLWKEESPDGEMGQSWGCGGMEVSLQDLSRVLVGGGASLT